MTLRRLAKRLDPPDRPLRPIDLRPRRPRSRPRIRPLLAGIPVAGARPRHQAPTTVATGRSGPPDGVGSVRNGGAGGADVSVPKTGPLGACSRRVRSGFGWVAGVVFGVMVPVLRLLRGCSCCGWVRIPKDAGRCPRVGRRGWVDRIGSMDSFRWRRWVPSVGGPGRVRFGVRVCCGSGGRWCVWCARGSGFLGSTFRRSDRVWVA